ncbi:cyclic nucleotide-binding protein [Leptolyngbya sp. 'hensonii']|uniref:cyclic nucleotide-binding domain-containing protein n=1 Tax=Leptolyngbya sp. 'hensonii' TaxID=1922337 RepID=UPI00094F9AA1|nr:cyclic nucleotide-binding domain-containing protein [Leptolyngbya sp. 'hensonii']OLP16935.1 cyclic nucleotide-binding protein [Leptolyngbya sp. 'hensonii']
MLQPAHTVKQYQKDPDPLTFAAGDLIFKEGDQGEYMYGILEGQVEMTIEGKSVETLEAGDIFGEGALVHSDRLRMSTAIAKTDCQLAYLNEEHFLFAVQETPMFALQVMRSYSDRFRRFKALSIS